MEYIPQKLFKATVSSIEIVAQGVKKFTFKIDEPFSFSAGQYVWIEISEMKVNDLKGNRRAFTICNVPNQENTISITTRISNSGYKQTLFAVDIGDNVKIHGPFGSAFILNHDKPKSTCIVMIAGGLGVASFLAAIEAAKNQLPRVKIFLIYLNNNKETTPFLSYLEELKNDNTFFDYKVTYDFFSFDYVRDTCIGSYNDATWWISGPQAMIDYVYDILEKNGVSIIDMVFENYYPKHKNALTLEKVKEQLEKSGLFTELVQNFNNHVVITDANGIILYANKAVETATGYSQEEMLGNTPRIWGGMMSDEFYRDFWSKKKTERFMEAEIVNRHKSGKIYHAVAYITQILNNEKELIGYVGMEKDISKKIEEEERILLQYELVSQIFIGNFNSDFLAKTMEAIAEGLHWDFGAVWVLSDRDNKLHNTHTWSNRTSQHASFEKVTKETVFDNGIGLPGRVFKNRISEWIADVVYDNNFPRAKYAKEADLHTGFAFPVHDGKNLYAVFEFFSHSILPLDEYLLKTYYLTGYNIGQRLVESKQRIEIKSLLDRFDLATKSANIGVWERNLEKNELFWDDTMYHLFGVDKANINAESNLIAIRKKTIHHEDLERVEQEELAAIQGVKNVDTIFRVMWKDSSIHYLRAFSVVNKNTDGNPVSIIGVNWDITKEKETDRIKSEFVSLASHQLRTPLTGIEWTAELFSKKETLTETGRKYLRDISFSAKRLSTLVRLLLDVSRIEGGNIGVSPEPIELVSFMKEHLENMQVLCAKKGLTCLFAKENPEECLITTDKNLLRYIVQNIISNAVEYTNTGGNVFIVLEVKSDKVRVKVQDTGIGIPKKEQGRVFEKFFRASNAITAKPDGSGLGLYIVSGAVKLLGGKIWFESDEGKGTTFFIELQMVSQSHVGEKELIQMED